MSNTRTSDELFMTGEDRAYIHANFVSLEDACRERGEDVAHVRTLIRGGRLPRPAYVLDGGTEMVAGDYFALVVDAGGVDALRAHFADRYRRAAEAHGHRAEASDVDDEWKAYLSGEYAVCLHRVTPETIYRKGWLMREIEQAIAGPQPDDAEWRARLEAYVDEFDELEREFAPYDRRRWGPVSRDRLVTAVRERFALVRRR